MKWGAMQQGGRWRQPRRMGGVRLLCALLLLFLVTAPAHGYIIINAPMTDTNASGWMLGGNPNAAILTGNGGTDPVGSGWLRLTNNTTNQTGYAYNTTTFDLSAGLLVQFDYATWGGTGADGYSVFLFDANVPSFNIGAFGGSLGYAQKLPPTVNPAVPGISGGYVGIGVDEFGNFAAGTEGRYRGPGQTPNTVTVRGSVVGFGGGAVGQTSGSTSYPWIATSANNGSLWYSGASRPDQTSTNYRKVIMTVTPAPNPVLNVWIQFGYNTAPVQMISSQALPAISASQQLQVGFGASTGASTNYHEIRNLLITTLNASSSVDLGITKTAVATGTTTPIASALVGDTFQYLLTVRNFGPNNTTATGVGVVDTFPASVTPGTWSCAVISGSPAGTSCGASSGSGNLNASANLPKNGGVTYTLNATLNALPPGSSVTNRASLVIPGGVTDYYPNNDSDDATITVPYKPPTVAKGFSPAVLPTGQTSRMTVTLTNPNSVAATGAAFTDSYPSGLVNTSSASRSTTCANATVTAANNGTSLKITGATIPANGSCTVSVNVTSNTAGSYANSTGAVTTTNIGDSPGASATLVAMAPPTVTKSFTPNQIPVGGTSVATITLTNPNSADITGAAFSDSYVAGLANSAAASPATTCPGGTVTAANGGTTLALSGATIPANGSCTVTVNVTSAAAASYADPTGSITTGNAGTGSSATATLTVLRPPTVAQSFSPATILPGGNSLLTVTLTNPNATPLTGAAFSDSYPANLVNAAAAGAATTCGGTVTAANGGTSLSLAGGTIPANGSCTVTVNVTGSSAGAYTNSTGTVSTDYAGAGSAVSATLNVMAPPSAALLFTPSQIAIGGTSQLKVTLSNPNAVAITGAAFSDSYPANMVNTAAAAAATTCSGGTVSAANNGSSLSLSGATIPAGGSCTVTVNVTVTANGAYSDSTGPISTGNAGTGSAATASLNGPQPPSVALSFTPSTITAGSASLLTVTLSNPNAVPITGAAFSDSYPSGLVNGAAAGAATTCSGGTVTAANGGNSLSLSGGTIPANGSCTVTVNVTSAAFGSYTDSTGTVSTANAGNGAAASGTVVVMAPPAVAMTFAPSSVLVNTPSVLSVTITNPNTTTAITSLSFSDSYPSGMVNSSAPAAATTCGGTVSAAANGSSLALSGGSVPAGGSCTVTVNVTAAAAGSYTNSTGPLSSGNAGSGSSASATLTTTLLSAPTAAMGFAPAQMPLNTVSVMTVTLSNPSGTAVTGASFSDSYPAGMVNAAAASGATTCSGGTVSAANGGTSLSLSGATIPANGSCTVTVNVSSAASGVYINSTGSVTSSNAASAAAAGASLAVLAPPTAAAAFSPASVLVNTSAALTVTLTNGNVTDITGASFSAGYPSGLVNTSAPAGSTTCSGGTVTAAGGGNSLALSGATIPAGRSCTVTVNVTSASAGSYTSSTGVVSTGNAGSGSAASATLTTTLLAAPTVTKSFAPNQVVVNGTTLLTVTLSNPTSAAVTGVAVSDAFPASPGQMVVATGASLSNSCGGTAVIAANKYSFSLTGGTIPANGSCSLSVGVSAPTIGSYTNSTSTVTSTDAVTAAAASAVLTVAPMTAPSAVLSFTPNQIGVGGSSVLKVTLSNPNSVAITGAGFTDNYPAGLLNAPSAAAATTCSGGTVTASDNGASLSLSGGTIPANGSCTVTVNVTATAAGSYLDSTGAIGTGNAGTGTAASSTLSVLQAPSVGLSFSPALVMVNDTSLLTVTLSNPNAIAVTGVAFSDSYSSGLVNASAPGAATTCISGSVTAAGSGSSLTLSGVTIPGNGSCTVAVNVTSAAAASYTSSTGSVSTTNAGTAAGASGTLAVTNSALLSVLETVSPVSPKPGDVVTYTAVVTNTAGYAKSVVVLDFLSPYGFWAVDPFGTGSPFQFVEGTPPSGLTLGTPLYSSNYGSSWSYLPTSGAGNAPAGYDGNVTNFQIPMNGLMNPNGANFKVIFKVRVK